MDRQPTQRRIEEPRNPLTKLGIHLDSSLSILQRLWQSYQLSVRIRSVIVSPWVIWIPLDTFRVCLNGTSEITLLEQRVSFLPGLSRLLRIDVCQFLGLSLATFGLAKFVEDVWSPVFRKRLVEVFDSRGQISGLDVGCSNTPVGLGDKLVVRPDLGRKNG